MIKILLSSVVARWVFVNLVLLGCTIFSYYHGAGPIVAAAFTGAVGWAVWIIVGWLGVGLCMVLKSTREAQWISVNITKVGLIGTTVGLILGTQGFSSTLDKEAMIGAVMTGLYIGLHATVAALICNLWLRINLALVRGHWGN